MTGEYRFTFGPWNIHEGADPFGPPVREPIEFSRKLKEYKKLGFDGVQFHDDDAVPDINNLSGKELIAAAVGGFANHRRCLYLERPGLQAVCERADQKDD